MKLSLLLASLVGLVSAHPAAQPNDELAERATKKVNVVYPEGSVTGVSSSGVESFRGLPFAQPPVGSLRLKPPLRYNTSVGSVDGTGTGPSCPQMYLSTGSGGLVTQFLGTLLDIPFFQTVTDAQEDCLTLNVQRPAGTTSSSSLPVLFWIFGGGFEFGSTATYDGSTFVTKGININEPFIFVATNYRLGGWGFLAGKEILADGAANLGLLDQRAALEWVADNIAAFGGDPDRVTIWGESAGSISVFDQMALYGGDNTYKGKPLFRAGIMDSGSIVPAEATDSAKAQAVYDQVVSKAGCSGQADTLACLRGVPYQTYLSAVNSLPGFLSYSSVSLSYLPRPDGTVLPASPESLLLNKQYAAVPMIIGDQEDEGTLLALFQSNLSTTADIVDYLHSLAFHQATAAQVEGFVNTYPDDPAQGSPFRTGNSNQLYKSFKRLAAMLGDLVFTLSRRAALVVANGVNPSVPSWSYLASYDYGTPFLGTFHVSDILQVFYGIKPNYAANAIQTYYINFLTNLDPNVGVAVNESWPRYSDNQTLLNFFSDHTTTLKDDFRSESYNYLLSNVGAFHV